MKQKAKWILFFSLLTALLLTALTNAGWDGAETPDGPLRAVVLYEENADAERMEAALRDTEGVTLLCRYDTFFTGAAVEADAKVLAALGRLDGVAGVGLAERYDCAASSRDKETASSEEGLALMEADGLWKQGYTGDGVVIAVLDSGLNTAHEAFADSSLMKSPALSQADVAAFAEKGGTKGRYVSSRIPFAYDYYSRDDDVDTGNHHGTHVTALAAGYARDQSGNTVFRGAAPAAQILSMKIFPNGSGGGTDDTIILRALEDAWNLGADVINISVGTGAGFSGSDVMDGVYCRAFTQMAESGVIICCAAGNSAANVCSKTWSQPLPGGRYTDYGSVCSPGSLYGALAVAAAGRDGDGAAVMADYSSWGPASGLHLAPALTAFGGPVSSASASSSTPYRSEAGTSMASPYAAGSFAVLLQAVRERGVTDKRQAASLAQAMMESHTRLLTDEASGLPVSPRRQGAGLVDLDAAVSGSLVVMDPLIELGGSEDGRFTLPVTLRNLSDRAVTVSLSVQVLTDDYIEQDGVFFSRMAPKDISGGVTVSGGGSVTVPASGTAAATLQLSVGGRLKRDLDKVYPNGFYVEGYVTASGGGQTARGTFLGYCGSWPSAPVLEPVDFRDLQDAAYRLAGDAPVSSERRALPEDMDGCLEALGAELGANLAFLADEAGERPKNGALLGFNGHAYVLHDDARSAIPSRDSAAMTAGGVLCVDLYAQRNAACAVMLVSNPETGEVYYACDELLIGKSDISSLSPDIAPSVSFAWEGTNAKDEPLPAGTRVRVDVYAWLDVDEAMQAAYAGSAHRGAPESCRWLLESEYDGYRALSFPVTVDGAPPAAEAAMEGNTLTLTIRDDQYAAYAAVWDGSGTLLAESAFAPEKAGEACELTVNFTGGALPDTVYIQVEDYATHRTGYALDLKALAGGGDAAPERCAAVLLRDVQPGDWYHEAVDYMMETGAMEADEGMDFLPGKSATRWEIVAALHRANGSPKSGLTLGDLPFHDVSSRTRYAAALCWAYENKLVSGRGDGAFYGTAGVTRQELAVMLYRCAKLEGKDGASGSLTAFPDSGSVADWAKDAMAWAVGAGLIKGNESGSLAPAAGVTRAETAQILMRYMQMD